MSVVEYNILAPGTWGPRTDDKGTRTYQITIEAFTDNANDSGISVLATNGLPRQYVSQHPQDPFAVAVTCEPEQDQDDAQYWRIAYGYSTFIPEFAIANLASGGGSPATNPGYDIDNPLLRRPKVSWSGQMFKMTRYCDFNDNVYANKAGEMLELGAYEYPRLVLNVQRNLASFSEDLVNDMMGSVNDAAIIGRAKRRVYCKDLRFDWEHDKGITYANVRGEFIIGASQDILLVPGTPADGWWFEKRLNAGYSIWDPARQVLVPINLSGQRTARPMPLDSNGFAVLTRDEILGNTPNGQSLVNYLFFRDKPDADFASSGIFA